MIFTYVKKYSSLFLVALLLSGCLLPKSELAKNQKPNEAQLDIVQTAIDQYVEDNDGLVPILTVENDTPIFQKYLIDFDKLKETDLLAEIPGNAFENGGFYQYGLILPDETPQVKLIDLRNTESIRKVNIKIDQYRSKHTYPPYGEEIANGIFNIDYDLIGLKNPPYIVSPYTNENLPIIMDIKGTLHVDYRIDLAWALKEYDHDYKEGDDIRYLLPENTPFLPAYSLPYTIKNNEPIFIDDK